MSRGRRTSSPGRICKTRQSLVCTTGAKVRCHVAGQKLRRKKVKGERGENAHANGDRCSITRIWPGAGCDQYQPDRRSELESVDDHVLNMRAKSLACHPFRRIGILTNDRAVPSRAFRCCPKWDTVNPNRDVFGGTFVAPGRGLRRREWISASSRTFRNR